MQLERLTQYCAPPDPGGGMRLGLNTKTVYTHSRRPVPLPRRGLERGHGARQSLHLLGARLLADVEVLHHLVDKT